MGVKMIIKIYTMELLLVIKKNVNVTLLQLYVVVSQQSEKHLYLTNCLNAHNHNMYKMYPGLGYVYDRVYTALTGRPASRTP